MCSANSASISYVFMQSQYCAAAPSPVCACVLLLCINLLDRTEENSIAAFPWQRCLISRHLLACYRLLQSSNISALLGSEAEANTSPFNASLLCSRVSRLPLIIAVSLIQALSVADKVIWLVLLQGC